MIGPTVVQRFCYNLGSVFRNQAILLDLPQVQRNRIVGRALYWFAHGPYVQANTLLGISFKTYLSYDIALEQRTLSLSSGTTWPVEKVLQYRDALEIKNIDSFSNTGKWALVTATSHSTRIEQDSLLGFVFITTRNGDVQIKPVRAGVDVAEWSYEFPDIPPRHSKPAVQIPLPDGGLGYPLCWTTANGDSMDRAVVAFLYPQAWHVVPGWKIIELSVTNEDRCSLER